jgi:hypothetical protein
VPQLLPGEYNLLHFLQFHEFFSSANVAPVPEKQMKQFKLLNGALVYHMSRAWAKRYLLPEALRLMVLEDFHSSCLRAHFGVTKTLNRIAKVFYWPDMRREVCAFVRRCQGCQWAKHISLEWYPCFIYIYIYCDMDGVTGGGVA